MKKLLSIFILFTCGYFASSQGVCELTVKIENIKKIKGSIKVAIYDHSDHFLSKEIMSGEKEIKEHTVSISFKDLGVGTYAISVFHDENENGKLDSNFMGIPSEPYGFSNNAKGMFGPPSFEDCKIELKGASNITIVL